MGLESEFLGKDRMDTELTALKDCISMVVFSKIMFL